LYKIGLMAQLMKIIVFDKKMYLYKNII
jgi:hypothetical protein